MEKHEVRPAIPVSFQQVADGDAVRSQVSRILSSPAFQRSERLRRFLAYVVEETLAGRGDKLKEYTIALAVFDRPSFDPDVDSIVPWRGGFAAPNCFSSTQLTASTAQRNRSQAAQSQTNACRFRVVDRNGDRTGGNPKPNTKSESSRNNRPAAAQGFSFISRVPNTLHSQLLGEF
jgi:hypothetical protein